MKVQGTIFLGLAIYFFAHGEMSILRFAIAVVFSLWTFKLDPKAMDGLVAVQMKRKAKQPSRDS